MDKEELVRKIEYKLYKRCVDYTLWKTDYFNFDLSKLNIVVYLNHKKFKNIRYLMIKGNTFEIWQNTNENKSNITKFEIEAIESLHIKSFGEKNFINEDLNVIKFIHDFGHKLREKGIEYILSRDDGDYLYQLQESIMLADKDFGILGVERVKVDNFFGNIDIISKTDKGFYISAISFANSYDSFEIGDDEKNSSEDTETAIPKSGLHIIHQGLTVPQIEEELKHTDYYPVVIYQEGEKPFVIDFAQFKEEVFELIDNGNYYIGELTFNLLDKISNN